MFCLQIHARAECTKNFVYCTRPPGPSEVYKILSSLYIQQVRVFVNKTRTLQSLTHLIYNMSSLVVLATKAVRFRLQNKIKQMRF